MASGKLKKSDAPALNIQAYIRVRPLGSKEKKSPTLEFGRREVSIKCGGDPCRTKTLTFDRVFEEDVKQVAVYSAVVKPMIKEVLAGYNCTVFAYGQTGTGKTYTMTGEQGDPSVSWEDNTHAGIIPRAMEDLFAELANQTSEYQVTVSYMELYNEKIGSLISDTLELDQNIQMHEASDGGIILRGLTPTPVKSRDEAFQLLQRGAERRHVASTMMNHNSSRSHTIFTINVNIKESVIGEKEDVLRIGKLHLVDLAGSENVSKSGVSRRSNKSGSGVNKRWAEVSNINKSLLTLGRVITSIVDNKPHIPYRESKLTRFLRDSLGGKTKTCIIGTISPHQANIDETESTLNYTFKARSIKNNPEKNQKISKKEFMQVVSEEIMKLKRELDASRHGEGFYISKESHEEMSLRMKELDIKSKGWSEKYNALRESYDQNQEMFASLSADFDDKCAEYDELEKMYHAECEKFDEKFKELQQEIVVREYLISQYAKTEEKLTQQAKACQSVVENLISTTSLLHDKIDRKETSQMGNIQALDEFKGRVKNKLQDCEEEVVNFFSSQNTLSKQLCTFTGKIIDELSEQNQGLFKLVNKYLVPLKTNYSQLEEIQNKMEQQLKKEEISTLEMMREGYIDHKNTLAKIMEDVIVPLNEQLESKLSNMSNQHQRNVSAFKGFLDNAEVLDKGMAFNKKFLSTTIDMFLKELTSIANDSIANTRMVDNSTLTAEILVTQAQNLRFSLISQMKSNEKLMDDLESLIISAEKNEELASVTKLELKDNVRKVMKFKGMLEEDLSKYSTNLDQTHDLVKREVSMLSNHHRSVLDETETQYRGFVSVKHGIGEALERDIGGAMKGLQEDFDREQGSVKMGYQALDTLSGLAQSSRMTLSGITDTMCSTLREDIVLREQQMEQVLREEHRNLSEESCKAQKTEEIIKTKFTTIDNEITELVYQIDAPLGNTPAKNTKEDVKYPKELIATAPRLELLANFKQREEDESLDQTASGSSSQQSFVTAKDFHGMQTSDPGQMHQLTMSAQPHRGPSSLSQSRRSQSMSDLNLEIPQVPDDKENVSIGVNSKSKVGAKQRSPSLKSQKSPVRRLPLKASNHAKTSKNSTVKS